ncbi:MAG: DUF951 domain-containing protein [bacterium]|nr:DUF951 domain-containing protein [bacterium]
MKEGIIIQFKKKHPCGSDLWKVLEMRADVKIECLGCGRVVVLDREEITRKIKRTLLDGSLMGSSRVT